MGEKKGKAMVLELIDDLIRGDQSTATSPPKSDTETALDRDKSPSPPSLTKSKTADATLKLPTQLTTHATQTGVPPSTQSAISQIGTKLQGSSSDAFLLRAESLRIAQERIHRLEEELERLRFENERLAAAGETMLRRADELQEQLAQTRAKSDQAREIGKQEVDLLKEALAKKDKDLGAAKIKLEELEMRLSSNVQRIRVRERELENRLELMKMEGAAVVRSKDEMILDLKRQMDQLNFEMENYRSKGKELGRQLHERQDVLRRTVKALRLALSMLEGADLDDSDSRENR